MKTKLVIIITIILSLLVIVINKGANDVNNSIISIFNPIKIWYKDVSKSLNNGMENYIFQATSIEKLRNKNHILEKNILAQKNYIEQSKQLKNLIPYLSKIKTESKVEITQTISYNKMNNFTEILLTRPKLVNEGVPYGLIDNGVVAGVSRLVNGEFFGYLTSNEKCRLSVQIGSNRAPGVAIGDGKKGMTVQFIPRSFPIKAGDKVVTSGLDGIFYANIPLGVVKKVELQSSYKVAYIDTYNDLFHPGIFFVLSEKKPTVFASSSSIKNHVNSGSSIFDSNTSLSSPSSLSSTPLIEIDQTRTDIVVPEQNIIPKRLKQKNKKIKSKSNNTSIVETTNNNERNNKPENSDDSLPIKNELLINSEQPQSLP